MYVAMQITFLKPGVHTTGNDFAPIHGRCVLVSKLTPLAIYNAATPCSMVYQVAGVQEVVNQVTGTQVVDQVAGAQLVVGQVAGAQVVVD